MNVVFVVPPYSKNLARALLKEPKVYFFDIERVKNDLGSRYENLIALSLLKDLWLREDNKGDKTKLYYLKDKEKREVDFLTVVDNKCELLIEAKLSQDELSKSLLYFKERVPSQRNVQVVLNLPRNQNRDGVEVVTATNFLSQLEEID